MKLEALILLLSLLGISLYHAWRYSKTSADPDWAYFNLYAFTGSMYGRDFPDCKTPGIHIYYWLLSRLVGTDVRRIKFANHFLVGSVGALLYCLTGNYWGALAYTVLVNAGWLLAFHGNVGQVPAALLALSLAVHPALSVVFWLLAVFFEPKLLPSLLVAAILKGWWFLALFLLLSLLVVPYKNTKWFRWLWESSVTIPARIGRTRNKETWFPWFTANPTLYILPWLILGISSIRDFWYWLPALAYIAFIALGKCIRSNHLIPLVPWIAFASPPLALWLAVIDFVSSGFYLGDIWLRYYPALGDINETARATGEWLKGKPGTLYVNGIHSGIYIHAKKPLTLGMAEQIEIREVAAERRKEMIQRWKQSPPDWVVVGDVPGVTLKPIGYTRVAVVGQTEIYKKVGGRHV